VRWRGLDRPLRLFGHHKLVHQFQSQAKEVRPQLPSDSLVHHSMYVSLTRVCVRSHHDQVACEGHLVNMEKTKDFVSLPLRIRKPLDS
jgi:hypothetical protein